MSRLGKKLIPVPDKTKVSVSGEIVSVKGPLGELSRSFKPDIEILVQDGGISIKPKSKNTETAALWGTYVSHIKNMISGVNKAFVKKLIIEGIGYKVELKGDKLVFALGFSHPVVVSVPKGMIVTVEKNILSISGIDKEEVGQFTAKVRDLKKPEPYKGKGIRYETEVIKMKQGKKSV
jgi:large subunit ribosomal protein L6